MMWPDGRHLNRDVVAKPALRLAEMANLDVPQDTRFLMVTGEKAGPEDRFSGEKICLVLTVWKWTDFDEIVGRVGRMLKFSGEGHSVSIHSENRDRQIQLALKTNVGRVNCNMPHAMAKQRQLVQRSTLHRHARLRHVGRKHHHRQHQLPPLPQLHLAFPLPPTNTFRRRGDLRRVSGKMGAAVAGSEWQPAMENWRLRGD